MEAQQSPQPLETYLEDSKDEDEDSEDDVEDSKDEDEDSKDEVEDSEDEVEAIASVEVWWWRLEPLLSTFRIVCKTYLILGIEVAIDEIMVHCHGRSPDTCKMPNKPIKQGYKIFALVEDGYVWHFQLSLRQHGIGELEKDDKLTPTGSMVLQMARLLPKFDDSHYVIYMDNYFTSIPLFSMLWKENIGAAGTTRPLGIDFPTLLIVLRKKWSRLGDDT
jgi:hypothetical protein